MATPRGFSVFVNIGAKVSSSVNAAAGVVERRLGSMGRAVRLQAAEMKAMNREMAASYKGMAAIMVGGGALAGLKGSIMAGSEYQHQLVALKNAGRTAAEISRAVVQAQKTMIEVPTAKLTDNLKILNETTLAYGDFQHALDNLSFNQKMGGMLQSILGDKIGDPGEVFNKLVRALELRGGKMDNATYQRQADGLYRAMIASGGVVNPDQFLEFAQSGTIPLRGFSEDFMTTIAPSLIQEFGGARAGTASTAFYNQIMGRVAIGGKALTQEWVRLGLVPKKGTGGNLSTTGWTAGSMKGTDLAVSDPLQFVEKILLPAMTAKGVDINDEKSVLLEAQKLFGRETGKRIASTYLDPKQRARIHADAAMYKTALAVNASYTEALANDPALAMAATATSIQNLEVAVGKAITPETIMALKHLANGINWLAAAVNKHPGLGKGIAAIFAGLAGLAGFKFLKMGVNFLGLGKLFGWIGRLVGGGLFGGVGKMGPKIPFMRALMGGLGRAFARLARGLVGMFRFLGAPMLEGIMELAPVIMEGLAVVFGLLSNPAGWAITIGLVVGGIVLLFRKQLEKAWPAISDWFHDAFTAMRDWAASIDWSSIGMAIANGVTAGGAGLIMDLVNHFKPKGAGASGSWGGVTAVGGDPKVIPPHVLANARAAAGGGGYTHNGDIHVHAAANPHETAHAVRKELKRVASNQRGGLHD